MPSDLCLCITAVGSWWGIALTTIFWKQCLGIEDTYSYEPLIKNKAIYTIVDESDSDYEPLQDPRLTHKKEISEDSYDMVNDIV